MISKPVRLTTSLLRWGKVSWLCCVGVVSSPTGLITLVSSLRENLLLHSSYFRLGSPNGRVICTYQAYFLAPLSGILGTSAQRLQLRHHHLFSDAIATIIQAPHSSSCCKGSLTLPTFLLCLLSCLVYFYFVLFVFFIKNQKN